VNEWGGWTVTRAGLDEGRGFIIITLWLTMRTYKMMLLLLPHSFHKSGPNTPHQGRKGGRKILEFI
jgi:hypothetical protein